MNTYSMKQDKKKKFLMPKPLQNTLYINQQILSPVLLKKYQDNLQAKQGLKYTILLVFELMGSQRISLRHKD